MQNNLKTFCTNSECYHIIFAKTFDFLPYKGKETTWQIDAIVNLLLNVSSQLQFQIYQKKRVLMLAKVPSAISKKGIPKINKIAVTKSCIDDSAIRKQHKYGTIR